MRLDRAVVAVVVLLAVLAGILAIISLRLGPGIEGLSVASALDGASVNTIIGVSFSEPMERATAERAFSISPHVPGSIAWSGNELVFTPSHPLAYDSTYWVRVNQSARDQSGRALARPYAATVRTQSEHLMYLGTSGSERGRLVLASVSGQRQIVGSNGGLVTDFTVSQDRSLVVYVKKTTPQGRPDEIWLMSLSDGSTQRVFARSDWSLSAPHLSPDNRQVVFLARNVKICRKYYGCFRDRTGALVYLLDLGTRKVRAFRAESDVPITTFVDFSPAGQIAYTDLGSALTLANPSGSGVVHIPNQGNALEFWGFNPQGDKAAFVGQTQNSTGGDIIVYVQSKGRYVDVSQGVYDSSEPAFSSSGAKVAYSAYRGEKGIEPLYGINVYDFSTGKTQRVTGEKSATDWAPAWSPDDAYIGFVRSAPQEAMYLGSGEIWVAHADGTDAHPLGGVGQSVQWVS